MIPEKEILNAKILIVDDQKLHLMLLEKILKTSGYQNICCTTESRKVVSLYQEFKPDLIVLDLIMPEFDGFMVMEGLRKLKRPEDYLPILAVSSEKGQEIHLKALQSGATDFIQMPYESLEIVMRIKNMIETAILHKQVQNQNKILETKVQERTKELRDTRLDIIQRLAHAAECRDLETGAHIVRMSQYCFELAKAVGMNDLQCELVLNASPLHDVGKIGIPDQILLKPAKLTPEEWETMKKHTTIGAQLLSGSHSPLMKMAEMIALTHHERWDGTGYPKGLKNEDIPLVGRICSICDVFDALTSERPYKKAWTVEAALDQIKKDSGTYFDPHLVEVFLNIFSKIDEIRKKYSS